MKQHSLRLRLLLLAAVLVAVAVLMAGIVLLYMFSTHIERRVAADLDANLNRAVALIDPEAETPALLAPLADPRYALPLSGLYWQIEDLDSGRSARSPSLVDGVLVLPGAAAGMVELDGPDRQRLVSVWLDVQFAEADAGPRRYRIIVAEDRRVIDQAIAAFGSEMSLALLVLGLALTLVAWVQVQLGLRPLEALRLSLQSVRRGEAERLVGSFPTEVGPLVREVNDLLEARDRSLVFARMRASDLAHGLKTPLAVIAATALRLRDKGEDEAAETLDSMSDEMSARIDYQLRLARLRHRPASHVMRSPLKDAVLRIARVLEKTAEGERLGWTFNLDAGIGVNLDPQDLIELLGVILENACQWAEHEIRVSGAVVGDFVEVLVEDDGPGLGAEDIARLGPRGERLDQGGKGSGFGIAIASEILELNGGRLAISRSPLGGLAVAMSLPGAGTPEG
ncbi:Signal transduction histidine kinase [Devosia enhydra]|uniref:histidine kinase n=1 Tax=Devosia enhydra TaxID=665118 RepID=A0A1K2HV50_9HYPH|nr:HAMP domain-containing sensor histidine kinase [Devosia enhydra]SFZ82525.1 Signal transduction histidine kinase [Devosia enhydra]